MAIWRHGSRNGRFETDSGSAQQFDIVLIPHHHRGADKINNLQATSSDLIRATQEWDSLVAESLRRKFGTSLHMIKGDSKQSLPRLSLRWETSPHRRMPRLQRQI